MAGHTKAFGYPVTQTRLDIQKAFGYPVTQTRLDIPRPLVTQLHRHGWTYQGLWLPSHGPLGDHKWKCSGTRQIWTSDLSVHSRGNQSTRRKPEYPEETRVPGGNQSTRRKPEYPEETRVPGGNQSTRRKPEYPEETTDIWPNWALGLTVWDHFYLGTPDPSVYLDDIMRYVGHIRWTLSWNVRDSNWPCWQRWLWGSGPDRRCQSP